jgi:hypothetical protein
MYRAKINMLNKHINAGFHHFSSEAGLKDTVLSSKISMYKTVIVHDNLKKSELPLLEPILYDDDKSMIICGISTIDKSVLKDLTSSDRVIEYYQPYSQTDKESFYFNMLKKLCRDQKITITDKTARTIVDLTGVSHTADTGFLYYETLKLINFCRSHKKSEIQESSLNIVESSGDSGFFTLFDDLLNITTETFSQFVGRINQYVTKDPQFLYGFFNYSFGILVLLKGSQLDKRQNAKEIASILGKKEFYIKSVLNKKVLKNRVSLLLSIVTDSLVYLETIQGDSVGKFLTDVFRGIEKGN